MQNIVRGADSDKEQQANRPLGLENDDTTTHNAHVDHQTTENAPSGTDAPSNFIPGTLQHGEASSSISSSS